MTARLHEYIFKNSLRLRFQWMNYITCELYLNKAIILKKFKWKRRNLKLFGTIWDPGDEEISKVPREKKNSKAPSRTSYDVKHFQAHSPIILK